MHIKNPFWRTTAGAGVFSAIFIILPLCLGVVSHHLGISLPAPPQATLVMIAVSYWLLGLLGGSVLAGVCFLLYLALECAKWLGNVLFAPKA